MTLWGELHKTPPDAHFATFSSSFSYDRRLLPYDVEGSRGWARELARIGILSAKELKAIERGLKEILEKARHEPLWLDEQPEEDVHSFVEARLNARIGEAALRLHTGRSRNDQVATDLRLYAKDAAAQLDAAARALAEELVTFGEKNVATILPGYTHLRRAQPVLVAHWALAYVEMLTRDRERLAQARARADVLPLGSAALAGTAYPVDRARLARELGFARASDNSLDATSDRDFVVDLLSAAALLAVHLSRLCEDLILYSSSEFGFLEIGDDVSTGSSLMPQKRNPDALELVRGKSGRVLGALGGFLATLKGLPLAYNRDLQEDKEALFGTVDTALACLTVMATCIRGLKVDAARCRAAAEGGFSNATDLADYLVRKGVPFRSAHRIVSRAVRECLDGGFTLDTFPLENYRKISDAFEQDLYASLPLEAILAARDVRGGTSKRAVKAALARARAAHRTSRARAR